MERERDGGEKKRKKQTSKRECLAIDIKPSQLESINPEAGFFAGNLKVLEFMAFNKPNDVLGAAGFKPVG